MRPHGWLVISLSRWAPAASALVIEPSRSATERSRWTGVQWRSNVRTVDADANGGVPRVLHEEVHGDGRAEQLAKDRAHASAHGETERVDVEAGGSFQVGDIDVHEDRHAGERCNGRARM